MPTLGAKAEQPETTSQLPYEAIPEITMSGKYQDYFASINTNLHAQGLSKKHSFNDDLVGAIYDFDEDGTYEFIMKNLTSCNFMAAKSR